jgi:hypothetical protein
MKTKKNSYFTLILFTGLCVNTIFQANIFAFEEVDSPSVHDPYAFEVGVLGGLTIASSSLNTSANAATGSFTRTAFSVYGQVTIDNLIFLEVAPGIFSRGYSLLSSNTSSQTAEVGIPANTINGQTEDVSVNYLIFPLIARLYLLPQMISVGAGPYVGIALSDVSLDNVKNTMNVQNSTTRTAMGWNWIDWGLTFSLRGSIPLDKTVSVLIEGRLNQGLTDSLQNAASKLSDLNFFLGLSRVF